MVDSVNRLSILDRSIESEENYNSRYSRPSKTHTRSHRRREGRVARGKISGNNSEVSEIVCKSCRLWITHEFVIIGNNVGGVENAVSSVVCRNCGMVLV